MAFSGGRRVGGTMLRTGLAAEPVAPTQCSSVRPEPIRLVPLGRRGRRRPDGPRRRPEQYGSCSPGVAAALGLWAALTFSSAVLVHGVVHAVGARGVRVGHARARRHARRRPRPAGRRRRPAGARRAGPRAPPAPRPRPRGSGARRRPASPPSGCSSKRRSPRCSWPPRTPRSIPSGSRRRVLCGLVALLCSAFLFRAARDRVVALLVALADALGAGGPARDAAPPGAPPAPRDPSLPALRPQPPPAGPRSLTVPPRPSAARSSSQLRRESCSAEFVPASRSARSP